MFGRKRRQRDREYGALFVLSFLFVYEPESQTWRSLITTGRPGPVRLSKELADDAIRRAGR